MKSKNKTAISLIVLVISILVLSILAATVIISLSNTNIMGQASSTVFKQDMASYKEAYEMYVTSKLAENATFDRSALNITYEDDEYEEIFGSVPDKYKEGLKVVNGKLVYETDDETEKAVVKELNMKGPELIGTETVTVDGVTRSKYIGYFADVDGDGTVDGVIFADLAHSASVEGDRYYPAFSYEAESGLKNYEVIEERYSVDGATGYGTKPVLSAIGNGKDRFYVMALSDITQSTDTTKSDDCFTWYDAAYDSGIDNTNSQITSPEFGKGKENTNTMISKWNGGESVADGSGDYGKQNDNSSYLDMWGVIQDKVYGGKQQTLENVKWFVPSKAEWSAFGVYLRGRETPLTTSNYSNAYGLRSAYWLSSLSTGTEVAHRAYLNYVDGGSVGEFVVAHNSPVRLAATF